MSALARWWRGWLVSLRIARREAWRGWPARRRSLLVAVLVGLPVLAASGMATVDTTAWSTVPPALDASQIPDGAQATLQNVSNGTPITQDAYAQGGSSTSDEKAVSLSAARRLAAARAAIPAPDRLTLLASGSVTAARAGSTDRFTVVAHTAASYPTLAVDPDLATLTGVGRLRSGRLPAADGEVVVNPTLVRLAGLVPGATLTLTTRTGESAAAATVIVAGVADIGVSDGPALVGPPRSLPGTPTAADATSPVWDTLLQGGSSRVLVSGPEPVTWAQVQTVNQVGWTVLSRYVVEHATAADNRTVVEQPSLSSDSATRLLQAEIIGLIVLQLVLLAAPAMAVGVRRRMHALALVAVTGADAAAVRRVVLALAVLMGAPGAAVGALAGVGIAAYLESAYGASTDRVVVPWTIVISLALAGVGVAALAALVPAVTAARQDPVSVLRGRNRDARRPRRTLRFGLPLVALGTGGAVLASRMTQVSTTPRGALTVLGIAVAEIGVILSLPAVLALAARLAERGPLFLRLALRDADRHRLRSVPAVAAAMAAIAGSIAAQMFFTTTDAVNGAVFDRAVPERSYVLDLEEGDPLTPAEADRWQAQARKVLAGSDVRELTPIWTLGAGNHFYGGSLSRLWGQTYAPRTSAGFLLPPGTCTSPFPPEDADLVPRQPCINRTQFLKRREISLGIAVGDASIVRAEVGRDLPEATQALTAGKAVITDPRLLWSDGTVHLRLWRSGEHPKLVRDLTFPAVVVDSPVLFDGVVPTATVRQMAPEVFAGRTASAVIAVRDRESLSDWFGPSDDLRMQLAALSPSAYPTGPDHQSQVQQFAVLLFASIVTLFGAASAVALAAAEGRVDASTLAAVGAAPRTRRSLAAMQALVIAGLGGLGGIASGLLAGWVLVQVVLTSRSPEVVFGGGSLEAAPLTTWDTGWHATVPWLDVVGLGVVLPLLLAAGAYLLTRSRLPVLSRRPT